ncbi:hypothetical protein Ae168Ps1_5683c [Pseudonocardia sp. Ae168_Ps1]|nr:hypothetical protein Ae168Ps1_5683c [Pseudonocardia sp. Ae168_Ps1]OLL77270.1 hypothetical protein Ae150APs1_5648 [Pseudonocardia sp. Ae150A_Ps1]OLL88620.1 hypothetical protein Ae263Ps1_5675c [Pseudonocardia sp. Ae263_Ps1]OLL91359.1 hypothetical protein Ae356Ps1_1256 [Pseudonocardia sp. Ae356_Ps1]
MLRQLEAGARPPADAGLRSGVPVALIGPVREEGVASLAGRARLEDPWPVRMPVDVGWSP